MASISTGKNGRRMVQFTGLDGERKTIRLGAVPMKLANVVKLKIEHLLAFVQSGTAFDSETIQWLGTIGDELAEKFATVGLIPSRKGRRLRDFLNNYIAGRANDGTTKGTTLTTIHRTADDLCEAMGDGTDMRNVGPEDAAKFKQWHQDKGHAPATTYRRLKMAKMLFANAVEMKVITENPFVGLKAKNQNPANRRVYVPVADIEKVIAVCPPFWSTLFALSRLGGMRTPSESLMLRWPDVDFETGRMTIHSPKTEHHEGGASRVCPVFANLRPHLLAARSNSEFVLAGPIADRERKHAAGPRGWQKNNLRTTALRMIRRAGLTPWPKLFQNLRASCETDLMRDHPIHVVTAWMGNTPKIALGHYLQTLDADFAKAIGGAAKGAAPALQNARQTGDVELGHELTESAVETGNEGGIVEIAGIERKNASRSSGQGGTRTNRNSPTILGIFDDRAANGGVDTGRQPTPNGAGDGHPDPRIPAILAAFTAGGEEMRSSLYAVATRQIARAA